MHRPQLRPGWSYLVLLLVPVLAAAVLLATLELIVDHPTAVAIPIGVAVGFVVIIASAVTLSAVANDVRRPNVSSRAGQDERGDAAPIRGEAETSAGQARLSLTYGIVVLLTFVVLTAVPAAVIVGVVQLLPEGGTLLPAFALPVILLVGLVGLLAVVAMIVAVFDRFKLARGEYALGLPQGSIQAVIALGLILIFAIIGVYLHGAADEGEAKDDLGVQLLTTVSTLVVAVAGFYFGAKATGEAADRVARVTTERAMGANGTRGGAGVGGPRGGGDAPSPVDEAVTYGTASPVTGLGAVDVAPELEDPEATDAGPELLADRQAEHAPAEGDRPADADPSLLPEVAPDAPSQGPDPGWPGGADDPAEER